MTLDQRFLLSRFLHTSEPSLEKLWGMSERFFISRLARFLGVSYYIILFDHKAHVFSLCYALASKIFAWALGGFQDPENSRQLLVETYWLLLTWLFPEHGKRSREARAIWHWAASASAVLGLHRCSSRNDKVHSLRVVMRGLPPGVQAVLLSKDWSSGVWKYYLKCVFCGVWNPARMKGNAGVYAMVSASSRTWYVGKFQRARRRNNQCWGGTVARLKDHVQNIAQSRRPQGHRQRYKDWGAVNLHCLFLFPLGWYERKEALRVEDITIRVLEGPTQQTSSTAEKCRARAFKPWILHRSRPNVASEQDLNIHAMLQRSPVMKFRFQKLWATWTDVVRWFKSVHGFGALKLRSMLYSVNFIVALAIFLGQSYARLDWKKTWAMKNPPEFLAKVYIQCKRLDHVRGRRAQLKILRFLRSAHMMPVKAVRIKVPARGRQAMKAVKRTVAFVLRRFSSQWPSCCRQVVGSRVRVQLAQAPNTSLLLSDHIRQAKKFSVSLTESISEPLKSAIDKRLDVRRVPFHVHIPMPDEPGEIANAVWDDIKSWSEYLQVDVSREELWGVLHGTLVSMVQPSPFDAKKYAESIRSCVKGGVLVPLDRDTRRRVVMSHEGYCKRLYDCFFQDPVFYEPLESWSRGRVAAWRHQRMKELLPVALHTDSALGKETVPFAYQLYKGKCLSEASLEDKHSVGLVCTKGHAHQREVISGAACPLLQSLAVHARALRFMVRVPRPESWILWNQSEVASVLKSKVSQLRVLANYRFVCYRCRCPKDELCDAKVDAAQFFKSASTARAIARTKKLIAGLQCKGFTGVAVRKSKRASGYVAKDKSKIGGNYKFVPFEEALAALEFCAGDSKFCVGKCVITRKDGWPMGGPLSPSATLVDLAHDIRKAHESPSYRNHCGWKVVDARGSPIPLKHCVAGCLHIDDCVVMSRIFCTECLLRGVRKCWPSDVGVQPEGALPEIEFLNVRIVRVGNRIDVLPLNVNASGLRDGSCVLKAARLVPFADSFESRLALRQFVIGKLCNFDQIVLESPLKAVPAVAELIAEAYASGWSCKIIGRTFASVPCRHHNSFLSSCRYFGRVLRKFQVREDLPLVDQFEEELFTAFSGSKQF